MYALTKIDLDVAKNDRLDEAADLAKKYFCKAIVVPPELVAQSLIMRGIKQAKFKIISQIDWLKGDQYGREKFRGITTEALSADGFEVMLTARDNYGDVFNELKYLAQFFGEYFAQLVEFRIVLGTDMPGRNKQVIEHMLNGCKHIPLPTYIRTTPGTRLNHTNSDLESLNKTVDNIKKIVNAPIKVSGAMSPDIYDHCKADQYGISIQQLKELVIEFDAKKKK